MHIFWLGIDKLVYFDFLNEIIKLGKQNIIFTPNPEILLKIKTDIEYKQLLEKANYLTPDWIGLYIAFQIFDNKYNKAINTLLIPYFLFNLFFRKKYLYKKYWDRICGSDLTKDLIYLAIDKWIKISIIDLYNPTDVKKVKSQKVFTKILSEKFPKLKFEYYIYNILEKENIINNISISESKILFSTLWMKKQEKSIIEIMNRCENIKLGLGIWSSFDYIVWFQKRAPNVWQNIWLEWLYRLLTWPKKIDRLKRLFNAIVVFTYEVIKSK